MYRSILSLSKIAHQLWLDHPFSQGTMTTEKTVWAGHSGHWGINPPPSKTPPLFLAKPPLNQQTVQVPPF